MNQYERKRAYSSVCINAEQRYAPLEDISNAKRGGNIHNDTYLYT